MKRLLLCIIAFGFSWGLAHASMQVSSSSYSVQSGQSYQASLSYGVYGGGSATLSKANSSGWHWLADGWGNPILNLSAWTSDTGPQTVEIWGEGFDDTWEEYQFDMVEVSVAGATNTPPVPSVVVDGYSHGATVTRPTGGSINVTVRFQATDANGNLTGIRPQVWDPAGNLNNNNGNFVAKTGSTGEVAWTVTLNQNGNWYFWTDAQDATIAPNSVSSGQWASGFRLNVVEAAPVPAITSATAVSGSIASACSYQITATNSPTSYTASGLPAGLTLNTASGLVSGTPTTAGVYVATVGAVNAHGTGTAQVTFSIGSGWASTVQSGYAYTWGFWQTAHFNLANAAINNSSAPAPAKADAQAVLNQISADAGNMGNYIGYVYKDYAVGVATGSASFERDPEMGIYSIYLTVSWPDHPLPVTFTFGNLSHIYDGSVKSATVVVSPSYATYTADLVRGPAAGSYTVSATAGEGYIGNATATLEIVAEAAPVPAITSATAVSGSIVSACSYQITATNSPTSYTASGLPAGLTLNTASGLVSGTPTTTGVYVATVGAVNAHGTGTAQVTFSIGSGTWTVVGEGYCFYWNYLRLDFTTGRTMVNALNAPQAFRDMALAIISDMESGAINSYTYSYNYAETYTRGPVTAEVEYVFDPETDTTTAYFVITGPDHPVPVSFSFSDLAHTYDSTVKGATVVVTPTYATYTADLTRGPAAGTYTITATATGAYSGSSAATLEITKAPQQIIFNDPGERSVGDLLTLVGSASSGLPVNFSVVSGPALLSDGVVSFTDVGRITITASQSGDNNYLPAVAVTRAFFVTTGNPLLDSDEDGVPDDIEIKIGLDRNNGLDCRVYNYVYDKTNRLITGPGGKYIMDTEGNIKEVKP